MTSGTQKLLTASSLTCLAMLVFAFLSIRHSAHHSAFTFGFFALLCLQSGLNLKRSSALRQPDTLIRLFPEAPATAKERP